MIQYHTYLTILVPAIITVIATYGATVFLMRYLFDAGIFDEDGNKAKTIMLPCGLGLAVAFGITAGILTYTFGGSFIFRPVLGISQLLAVTLSITLIAMVGFLDDINVRVNRTRSTGAIQRHRMGLKKWQKFILPVIGALPLMAINAGVSVINLPFIGHVNFGIIYPLVIIPLAVIFAANSVNILGGFDGMQPGMGAVAALGLLLYSLVYGTYMGLFLSSLLFGACIVLFYFNRYPAKVISGDTFTFLLGGTILAIATVGNAEAFALIIFIPWIIEFFLHLRRKFDVTDLGVRQKDGTFRSPYGKRIYSWTHVFMNLRKMTELDMQNAMIMFELLFVVLAFAIKIAGFL